MNITKTHKIIFGIVVTLSIITYLFWFISKKRVGNTTINTATSTGETVIVGTDGGYTIEQVPINEGQGLPQPIPDLDRKLVLYTGAVIAPEAKTYAEEKIKMLQTRIKSNLSDVLAWIDLGIHQKNAGDYEGAVLSWKYASKLSPTDYVSLGNLGNLYAYFIKDKTQAEFYYKQAISKGPTQVNSYLQFAEVYRDLFKDSVKAKEIVDMGLSKIPNDPSLLQLKNSFN